VRPLYDEANHRLTGFILQKVFGSGSHFINDPLGNHEVWYTAFIALLEPSNHEVSPL
jgi:hypothetical protein